MFTSSIAVEAGNARKAVMEKSSQWSQYKNSLCATARWCQSWRIFSLFGGFAPLLKKLPSEETGEDMEATANLHWPAKFSMECSVRSLPRSVSMWTTTTSSMTPTRGTWSTLKTTPMASQWWRRRAASRVDDEEGEHQISVARWQ